MNGEYIVGDALEELAEVDDDLAALVHLDDAWERPKRENPVYDWGADYETHGFETSTAILDEIKRVLAPGGWVIVDADDWFLPRVIQYLQDEWGDVAATYRGGGYRRVGSVTCLDTSGRPNRGSAGMYLTNAGYSVVFGHCGETDRRTKTSARQLAQPPSEDYGASGVKPLKPYRKWVEALTEPGELVIVPCAGTAPAAIAAEESGREWLAIDIEPDAKRAFELRFENQAEVQTTLEEAFVDAQ